MILAECNSGELLWVLGHEGIEGTEIADRLAKRCSTLFMEPEPACGISESSGTGCAESARNTGGQFQDKVIPSASFLCLFSAKRTVEFLRFNKSQPVTGLLIGHCDLKGHLLKLEITDSQTALFVEVPYGDRNSLTYPL
jgi:hypothetical protein